MREVSEGYKENSTNGGSLISPVSYKGDVMVQVWIDSRVLATICKWLESEGEYPRFLSHVVRVPLEMLVDHVVSEGKVKMVDGTVEARMLLEGRFHVSLNKGKKGRKNLLHNVTLSSRRGTDLGSRIDYTRYSEEEPVEKLGREEAVARFRKKEAERKLELDKAVKEEVEKARKGGLIVKESMSNEEYEAKVEEIKGRDAERAKLENAPFNVDDLPTVG